MAEQVKCHFVISDAVAALHLAAEKGNSQVVTLLLEDPRVDPSIKSDNGFIGKKTNTCSFLE
jgi:hypothetical protein